MYKPCSHTSTMISKVFKGSALMRGHLFHLKKCTVLTRTYTHTFKLSTHTRTHTHTNAMQIHHFFSYTTSPSTAYIHTTLLNTAHVTDSAKVMFGSAEAKHRVKRQGHPFHLHFSPTFYCTPPPSPPPSLVCSPRRPSPLSFLCFSTPVLCCCC